MIFIHPNIFLFCKGSLCKQYTLNDCTNIAITQYFIIWQNTGVTYRRMEDNVLNWYNKYESTL